MIDMTGHEANSLAYSLVGLAAWPFLLRSYPEIIRSVSGSSIRQGLRWLVVGSDLVLVLVSLGVVVRAAASHHDLTTTLAVALVVAHLWFLYIFIRRHWAEGTETDTS